MKELLTTINRTVSNRSKNEIKYIVIHYTASAGNAQNQCKYFLNEYRGASAHYFVNFDGEVWRCVEDKDIAWHCGAKSYTHPKCRNQNSIGIEMCVRNNGKWTFEDATVKATIELTKTLMAQYNIPIENVLRHYDVTGKNCPEPYVRDNEAWKKFKDELGGMSYTYGWHQDANSKRWWYQYNTTRYGYFKNCLVAIDGVVYAFDPEGWMIEGKFNCTTDENGAVYLA